MDQDRNRVLGPEDDEDEDESLVWVWDAQDDRG
jgi:hypothetical protein